MIILSVLLRQSGFVASQSDVIGVTRSGKENTARPRSKTAIPAEPTHGWVKLKPCIRREYEVRIQAIAGQRPEVASRILRTGGKPVRPRGAESENALGHPRVLARDRASESRLVRVGESVSHSDPPSLLRRRLGSILGRRKDW